MLALGTPAPPFALPEPITGATVSLGDLTGPALVVSAEEARFEQTLAIDIAVEDIRE